MNDNTDMNPAVSSSEDYYIEDSVAMMLSKIAAIQGTSVPKHRFLFSDLNSKKKDITFSDYSLEKRIIEIWKTLFPEGDAFQSDLRPHRENLPAFCFFKATNELIILISSLSDGSFSALNKSNKEVIVKLDDINPFSILYLKTKLKNDNSKTLPTTAKDWFIYTIKKRKAAFFEGVIATTVISILALVVSFFSLQVYDRVVPTGSLPTLVVITLGALIGIALELIAKEIRSGIIDRACKMIDVELSGVFFSRMLAIRMDQRPNTIGTFASQIKQFELVRNFMTSSTLFIFADVPFVFFFIAVIGFIGGVVALVPLGLLPLSLIAGFYAKWKLGSLAEQQLTDSNNKNGMLVEAIDGIESIKALGGEWKMLEFWKRLTRSSADIEQKIRSVNSLATSIPQSISQLSYVLMVAVGAYAITSGKITIGAMIACSIISNRALSPISQIAGKIIQWHHAKAALKGLDAMMKLETDRKEDSSALIPDECKGQINAEGIAFSYNSGETRALNPLNLSFNPSERVAIIGPVGSGKSTLIKLLSGLYKPSQGKVFLDQLDMDLLAPEFLRENIGYLTQDVRLFNGSLRYNLTMGLPTPGDSKILDACTKTGLIHIIKNHPKGLDLPIFEGGRGLSGGQRQMVGLTRMLLAKPKILLLDEPTASMDNDLELKIMRSIFSESDPYSLIVISTHKLALLNFVNRIIVIDKGKIAYDGSKETVLEKLKLSGLNAKKNPVPKTND